MLDLERLRAFVLVAELENVSRAAEQLHISQSPLSRQIAALERSLGLALFSRANKRLALTAQGRVFLAEARALLATAAAVEARTVAMARGAPAPVSIGYVAGAVYSGALGSDLPRYANAQVALRALSSTEQFAELQNGSLDVGYTHAPAPRGSGLVSTLVLREPFVLAAARSARERGARALLESHPLITTRALFGELRAACGRIGAKVQLGLEAADPAIILAFVRDGLGVAIVQKSLRVFARKDVQFRALPRGFGMTLEVHRVVRDTKAREPRS